MSPLNVFVLAAGEGRRLLPLSKIFAKPSLPVFNESVLSLVLNRVLKLDGYVAVNAFHLATQIKDICESYSPQKSIFVSHEDVLLGTGGGIRKLDSRLSAHSGPLLVTNADIVSTIDFAALVSAHKKRGACCTMMLLNQHEAGSTPVFVSRNRQSVLGIGKIESTQDVVDLENPKTYACALVMEAELLEKIPKEPGDLWPALRFAFSRKMEVAAYFQEDLYWRDIGTPQSYSKTCFELASLLKNGSMSRLIEMGFIDDESQWNAMKQCIRGDNENLFFSPNSKFSESVEELSSQLKNTLFISRPQNLENIPLDLRNAQVVKDASIVVV